MTGTFSRNIFNRLFCFPYHMLIIIHLGMMTYHLFRPSVDLQLGQVRSPPTDANESAKTDTRDLYSQHHSVVFIVSIKVPISLTESM